MKKLFLCVSLVLGCLQPQPAHLQEDGTTPPTRFYMNPTHLMAINGSSNRGHCANAPLIAGNIICRSPTTSVLFDLDSPILTGLDGNMWAGQLLTLQHGSASHTQMDFEFSVASGVSRIERVEVVLFNCPEWGISVERINLLAGVTSQDTKDLISTETPTLTSCASLIKLCLSGPTTLPLITLQFFPHSDSQWVHLAEVRIFAGDDVPACPQDTTLNTPPPPPLTTEIPTTAFEQGGDTTTISQVAPTSITMDTPTSSNTDMPSSSTLNTPTSFDTDTPTSVSMDSATSISTDSSTLTSTDVPTSISMDTPTSISTPAASSINTDALTSNNIAPPTTITAILRTVPPTDFLTSPIHSTAPPTRKIEPLITTKRLPASVELAQSDDCSTSIALACAITAITTALLATIIFMLVQIAICKCHPKYALRSELADHMTTTSAFNGDQHYKKVDGGERGVAMSDFTYTEEKKSFSSAENGAHITQLNTEN